MFRSFWVKFGEEKYANVIYTAQFSISLPGSDEIINVKHYDQYKAQERIVYGINGCLGGYEVGLFVVPKNSVIYGEFTRKVLIYNPKLDSAWGHTKVTIDINVTGYTNRSYSLWGWGDTFGKRENVFLKGMFDRGEEIRDDYPLQTPLSELPF